MTSTKRTGRCNGKDGLRCKKRVEIDKRPDFRMGDKKVGTPAWIRTKDQLIKSQLLYQLSYRGMGVADLLKGRLATRKK